LIKKECGLKMPRNPNFTLDSPTLGTIYSTPGVLVSAGGQEIREPFLGAYYDTEPENRGLYVVLPDADVYYFDIDEAKINPQGTSALIRFDSDDTNYLLRPVYNDDGEWMSKYKIELPTELLTQKVSLDAHDAIEKYLGVELGDPLEFFEMLYAYYEENFPNIVAVTYISSLGTYTRVGASWSPADLGASMYDNWSGVEIDPEKAQEFLNKYDELGGSVSVEEAFEASLDSAK
jgi:hypothetical protein